MENSTENTEHADRGHQGVEDADGEGGAACEGLGEVQLRVGIVVIIVRVYELHVAVVDELGDDGDAGAEASPAPLQHDSLPQRTRAVVRCRTCQPMPMWVQKEYIKYIYLQYFW